MLFLSVCVAVEQPGLKGEYILPEIELRIAADRNIDSEIVKVAMSDSNKTVRVENSSAQWFNVTNSSTIPDNNLLIVTKKEGKCLSLLVLLNNDDIENKDIKKIHQTLTGDGQEALLVMLTKSGQEKLANLTINNLNRYTAIIFKNQVCAVRKIQTQLCDHFIIPKSAVEDLLNNTSFRISDDEFFEEKLKQEINIYISPKSLIICLVFTLVLFIGAIGGGFSKKQKHPPFLIIAGFCIGLLLGAYIIGVQKITGTASADEDIGFFTETIHISILYVIIGGILGSGLGSLVGFVLGPMFSKFICYCSKIFKYEKISVRLKKYKLLKSKFSKFQKLILVICFSLILLYFLFPPWEGCDRWIIPEGQTEGYPGSSYEPMGFHFFSSKEALLTKTLYVNVKIDYNSLFKMVLITFFTCVVSICLLHFLKCFKITKTKTQTP